MININIVPLTIIIGPLNLNVAADGQSYFHLKFPHLHLRVTAFSLPAVKSDI
jgi:hypothetical protein